MTTSNYMSTLKTLSVKWSISKGRETYGYNICKLIDSSPEGKVFKCLGGGYDMLGTVLADWVEDQYQSELLLNSDKAYGTYEDGKYKCLSESGRFDHMYGMYKHVKSGEVVKITLDGACGVNSVERVIKEVLGLTIERIYNYNKRGQVKDTIGFNVYKDQ